MAPKATDLEQAIRELQAEVERRLDVHEEEAIAFCGTDVLRWNEANARRNEAATIEALIDTLMREHGIDA